MFTQKIVLLNGSVVLYTVIVGFKGAIIGECSMHVCVGVLYLKQTL